MIYEQNSIGICLIEKRSIANPEVIFKTISTGHV